MRPWGTPGCKIWPKREAGCGTRWRSDLAKLFDLPLQETERIVRHREEKGPFASVDALKGVAGVTTATIDPRAQEIEF